MSTHSILPKEDVFPAGQLAQAVASTPPVTFPKVPGGHLKSQEVLPGMGLKEPLSHGSQASAESLPRR